MKDSMKKKYHLCVAFEALVFLQYDLKCEVIMSQSDNSDSVNRQTAIDSIVGLWSSSRSSGYLNSESNTTIAQYNHDWLGTSLKVGPSIILLPMLTSYFLVYTRRITEQERYLPKLMQILIAVKQQISTFLLGLVYNQHHRH